MHDPIPVLDHGYVRLVETWGMGDAHIPEAGIIEAARQSTQGNFQGWENDQKLLTHLLSQQPPHSGPFEFAGMVLEVHLPIFVVREWHRHRTMSYAEMSGRYAPLKPVNFIPTLDRLMAPAAALASGKENRQAGTIKGAEKLTPEHAQEFIHDCEELDAFTEHLYQKWLSMGIPKELARIRLPVGRYTKMRASANLRNWMAFMMLRAHPNAQLEIQEYARAVGLILIDQFPYTWKWVLEHTLGVMRS
jgi:thymidylate synthase (FAD)